MSNDNETLITHLEALRETLLKCFISLGIVLPFTFLAAPKALNYLISIIIGNSNITLNYFSPMDMFLLQCKTAIVMDIVICFPYMAKKIWDFILPALYDNEKKFIKTIVLTSTLLFVFGVAFCIFTILPMFIKFGMSFATSNIKAVLGVSSVINTSLLMSIAFGIMFQVPLITHYLIKSGLLQYEAISSKRRYIIVLILIVAGILSPPDVLSQLLLAIPTYALFELGLLFSRK